MDVLITKLRSNFKGEINYSEDALAKYSHDASLFTVKPQLIVFPKDVDDVKTLVKTVAEQIVANPKRKYNLTARSAGTDMTGGPLTESVVVEFPKYFNKVLEVGNDYAVTQPGVYYRDFDKETLKKGMIMPAYPASRELCTVGGMTANNSGGEKTLLFGKVEDYVQHIKMVLDDGNEYFFKPLTLAELEEKKKLNTREGQIYRDVSSLIENNYDAIKAAKPNVSKNSAGYYLWNVLDKEKGIFDITKLIVGSQGTLGLITEVKFRLIKPKTHSRLVVVFLKSMKGLGDITNHLLTFKPESIESYDDHTFKLAVKLFPALFKRMKGNALLLMIKFIPEVWAVITGGIPKLVIMAEFTGDTEQEAHDQAVRAEASLKEFHIKTKIADSPEEVGKYWTIRRESFSMLRQHIKKLRTAPFIDDFIVKPELLPEFLPKLYTILDQYKLTYTIAGHVGNGNFHIIPLMDMTDMHSKEIIVKLSHEVNTLVLEYKGSITAEHNDGMIRTPYLKQMYGEQIYKLFQDTKNIFDPRHMFNPGKKVDGTEEYAMKHIEAK